MRTTWRDGITTLAALFGSLIGWAYFHDWTWPLTSSTRWVAVGLALVSIVMYVFGYLLDATHSAAWAGVSLVLLLAALGFTSFGLAFASAGYITALLWTVGASWATTIAWHLVEHMPQQHGHSHA